MLPPSSPLPLIGPERALAAIKPAPIPPPPPAGTPQAPAAAARAEWAGALRAPDAVQSAARTALTAALREHAPTGPPPAFIHNILDRLPTPADHPIIADMMPEPGASPPPGIAPPDAPALDKRL